MSLWTHDAKRKQFLYLVTYKVDYTKSIRADNGENSYVNQREREMFYLTTHSTHFIYGYMASDMVKDHSDSERGNPLPPQATLSD